MVDSRTLKVTESEHEATKTNGYFLILASQNMYLATKFLTKLHH